MSDLINSLSQLQIYSFSNLRHYNNQQLKNKFALIYIYPFLMLKARRCCVTHPQNWSNENLGINIYQHKTPLYCKIEVSDNVEISIIQ